MKLSVHNVEFTEIRDSSSVKLIKTGNIFEVISYLNKSKGSDVRKLSNDTYYRLRDFVPYSYIKSFSNYGFKVSSDGELINVKNEYIFKPLKSSDSEYLFPVKFYKKTENRFQSPNELRRTFKKIRNIINCNVTVPECCKFCTLTYAENMTDTKRLCDDFRKFNQRFKRYVKNNFDMGYQYIAIAEPQARGAWHMHIIYIFDDVAPYIHYSQYSKIWGLGAVDLKAFKDIDNIGAYFSAYLSDIAIDDNTELTSGLSKKKICKKKGKRVIKGGRLSMYPTKFNILRTSRNIKRPIVEEMSYTEAKKEISSLISIDKTVEDCCTFRKCIEIFSATNQSISKHFYNKIWYEYYNISRKRKNRPITPIKEKIIKNNIQESPEISYSYFNVK